MSRLFVVALVFGCFLPVDAGAQRRSRATATFAVLVADPAGTPVADVLVTLDGPTKRAARTEAGRIAFEGLVPGSYRLRFEREGFVTFDREITARGGAPIEVKVTLEPVPKPPAPVEPPAPPPSDVQPTVLDLPTFIENNYVKREPRRISPLACAAAGSATLVQFNETLAEHAHDDADEFVYVIAGEGMLKVGTEPHHVTAGAFALVPRGAAHSVTPTRGPLVALSIRAGKGCQPAK